MVIAKSFCLYISKLDIAINNNIKTTQNYALYNTNLNKVIPINSRVVILAVHLSIYLSIGINVRFAAMMADVGDGLL